MHCGLIPQHSVITVMRILELDSLPSAVAVILGGVVYVNGSAKTRNNRSFSNSCLVNIYNLPSQVYPLEKFQPHMPIALGVTALQSSNNRKIDCTASTLQGK